MEEKKPKFIITTFAETAEYLKDAGFVLVSHSGNQWTFLNNSKMLFTHLENVAFTDKLNF